MADFDFRLKAALREIEKIVEKFELGAVVSLYSKTHGEYKLIVPKWAVFNFDFDPNGTYKFKVSHKGRTDQDTQSSYAFLFHSRDVCENYVKLITSVVDGLVEKKALVIEKVPQPPRLVPREDSPEGYPI